MRNISLLALAFVFVACGKWIVGPNPPNTPQVNYDIFYEAVKGTYSFFPEKQVDWDSLDRVYRPLIHDDLGNDSLYQIMARMLYVLEDGHVNLYTNYTRSRNADWYVNHPRNFNRGFVNREYWGTDYLSSGPLLNNWLEDSIGYVYYGSFSQTVGGKQLTYVLNRFAEGKGLIIDVRDNGGGSMRNVYRLVQRFIPERQVLGYMDYKTGPGPDAYSERDSFVFKPVVDLKAKAEAIEKRKAAGKKVPDPYETPTGAGTWQVPDTTAMWLDKPIVVLTNRLSYSATNFFAGFMSQLPHVTIIGDRSGGGGGVPVSYELPNGWKFRLSASRTYLLDGHDIEGGIEPDIYQSTGPEDEIKGVDAIIERARAHILEETKTES